MHIFRDHDYRTSHWLDLKLKIDSLEFLSSEIVRLIWYGLFNPYPGIMEKSKTWDRPRARFPENPERSIASFVYTDISVQMAYIFVQRGTSPLILAYANWI